MVTSVSWTASATSAPGDGGGRGRDRPGPGGRRDNLGAPRSPPRRVQRGESAGSGASSPGDLVGLGGRLHRRERRGGAGLAPGTSARSVGRLHEAALVLHAARAVAQVDVEAAGVGCAELAVEAVRDQPLGALAPAAAAERGIVRRSSLRARASSRRARRPSAERERGPGARPLRQHHERQRARLAGASAGSAAATSRVAWPDRPGRGAGRDWSERRVLHQQRHHTRAARASIP